MNAPSAVTPHQHTAGRRVRVFFLASFILAALGGAAPIAALAGEGPDCARNQPTAAMRAGNQLSPEDLLTCARRSLEAADGSASVAQTVLEQPLNGYLSKLAETHGYRGAAGDLDVLKRRSTKLKNDALANRNAITVLDKAIASQINEIRPALSTSALADSSLPGVDIYRQFIRQKLDFLDSEQAKFYDRGPFEISRRSLLASSLESEYFLKQEAGNTDANTLRRALRLVEEVLDRLILPEYSYLRLSAQSYKSSINSNEFWRSSLYLALGEIDDMRRILHKLAVENKTFGLATANPGHIYIYRPFNLPHRIIVRGRGAEENGKARVEIIDPHFVNRYYNPAQLALYTCALLNQASANRIANFMAAIKDLVLSDYYVVVASADSAANLGRLQTAVDTTMHNASMRQAREQLLKNVADQEMIGFSKAMALGAQHCGIDNATRDEIFSPLTLQSNIAPGQDAEKGIHYLLFGGRMNANQANVLADFINKSIFPAVPKQLQEQFGMKARAYPARMKIDQS